MITDEAAEANRWIDRTFSMKLNNPASGRFVRIAQRLVEDDPYTHFYR